MDYMNSEGMSNYAGESQALDLCILSLAVN